MLVSIAKFIPEDEESMSLKEHVSLPVATGVLLFGIPYSISLLVQWMYGWPNKPSYEKYIEAIRPRRIYRLTRAVLGMLKCVQYGKLYFQWRLWYKNADNHKHFKKGISFGRRSNKLDLYYCPNMDQSRAEPTPVVVFVYGGAWGSGDRGMYCLLASQMAKELNAMVVCPDYSTYPKGNVLDMVQDIADSLLWVKENGDMFNIDNVSLALIGHSAGAHLCALTTLFLVNGAKELGIEATKQREITALIKGVAGLSGVYNILDHYRHEKTRGVEYVSPMHKAMGGIENFDYYSPTSTLKTLTDDQLKTVPPFCLIHGTGDGTVPVVSSLKFSDALADLSVKVSLYLLPQVGHTEMVTDLMAPDSNCYHTVYGCIKQVFNKYTGNC
ncbi:uncharacterized protein si:dkey-193c22.1 isoform X2 [Anguilla rostrata]|uniref:BD-FAE-like domain-containing protein n=1 Tax=Anguilla anguilla TaxID=7936 RepID=A0A9D3M3D9_ANGAN|nr:isoprenylcysteine alpha-carbonyl methylesterase ICME isoform X2 [Anguilla anguilla]KAG5841146.1 hypothetical protein ANANG_G00196480 [Anguilla anguilla]